MPVVLNFGLVKDSFRPRTVKVGALRVPGKNFFLFQLIFIGKKLFAGNLDTSRPTLEMAIRTPLAHLLPKPKFKPSYKVHPERKPIPPELIIKISFFLFN
jgi:hypothetical protein